jgi:hypothetical protein
MLIEKKVPWITALHEQWAMLTKVFFQQRNELYRQHSMNRLSSFRFAWEEEKLPEPLSGIVPQRLLNPTRESSRRRSGNSVEEQVGSAPPRSDFKFPNIPLPPGQYGEPCH